MYLEINERVALPNGMTGVLAEIADDICTVKLDTGTEEIVACADLKPDDGDGLSLPLFLDCRNPQLQAGRAAARSLPLTAIHFADTTTRTRDLDAETKAFMEAEAERAKAKSQNGFAKLKAKTTAKTEIAKGGRWDSARNMWLSPEQDYAEQARRIGMTPEQRMVHTKACAALDPGKTDCIANEARKTLALLNEAKLAVEGEKAERRAAYAMKRAKEGKIIRSRPLKNRKRGSI